MYLNAIFIKNYTQKLLYLLKRLYWDVGAYAHVHIQATYYSHIINFASTNANECNLSTVMYINKTNNLAWHMILSIDERNNSRNNAY